MYNMSIIQIWIHGFLWQCVVGDCAKVKESCWSKIVQTKKSRMSADNVKINVVAYDGQWAISDANNQKDDVGSTAVTIDPSTQTDVTETTKANEEPVNTKPFLKIEDTVASVTKLREEAEEAAEAIAAIAAIAAKSKLQKTEDEEPDDDEKPTHFLYKEVEDAIANSYNPTESNNSTICDIIAIYIKGQKILYTEAKTHCEQKLTFLMLPAILITVVCSVLGLVLKDITYGTTITSSLNGVNAFILALISYLKLDTRAEAHRTSAYKFDKLQSSMEFTSGKVLFMSKLSKNLGQIIEDTEKIVHEIKETNQFVLPEAIRYNYPKLSNINVFSEVKKIQNREMRVTNELKDLYNEKELIEYRMRLTVSSDDKKLNEIKEKIQRKTEEIIRMKDRYLEIDSSFQEEMNANMQKYSKRFQLCGCLKV